jgi:glycosyltransferase involved in cell wall biosynthesis
MRELVLERVTGLCFPAGDAGALAGRCLELLENEQLRDSLGAAAGPSLLSDVGALTVRCRGSTGNCWAGGDGEQAE